MAKLILMRHGDYVWHNKNVFTGWFDVPLSSTGIIEALKTGAKTSEIKFDIVVTSMQIRAIEAAMIALTQNKSKKMPVLISENKKIDDWIISNSKSMEESIIPVFRNWHLNEQCELPTRDKTVVSGEYGIEYLNKWCYCYDQPLENVECMRDTAKRVIPFFRKKIIPQLEKDKNVLISAHNNSLRLIVMVIENHTEKEIYDLEIPADSPFIYEMANGKIMKK
ncbi:phosphoglycerate mutase [Maribellus comscasis]|uniref:phosphoglycerate mutase (2,3-diphosphoglycerate-dependent) n=1 Tax=Maribellus comscasis TaxID=2681766 RepID=A0A6I6JWT0_9BACT|nr:histidine phosphatase family protein [Maribellus comscasis]QGY47586.1 phosphoglycerate mutase [Maribellus comscasis]